MSLINPTTGEPLPSYSEFSRSEVDRCLDSAASAFEIWRKTPLVERASFLKSFAKELRRSSEEAVSLIADEMGKPTPQGEAEVEKCARTCEYYADNALEFFKELTIATEFKKSFVSYQPLGIIVGVMPWNFPFWQAVRFMAPTLLAGNTILLKHASQTTGSALLLERILKGAISLPIYQTLITDHKTLESRVLTDPRVAGLSLTGSTDAGKKLGSIAVSHMKKCVLELGGSDPYLILEDADLDLAVDTCVNSRLINAGQSCIAAKRFLVPEALAPRFEAQFIEKMKSKKMGHPKEKAVDLGPMARPDLRDALHQQVLKSLSLGARLALGGTIPDSPGAFYPPTVLLDVKPGHPAFEEELFGPVAAIVRYKDEASGIHLANKTSFGLGAAIFSKDLARAEKIAREDLQAGSVFVNTYVQSDPRLPFGGIKDSGFGRELSLFGAHEFTNVKTIAFK